MHRTSILAAAPLAALLLLQSGCVSDPTTDDADTEGSSEAAGLVDPSWEIQVADTSALFIGISIVDDQTVWVSGTNGRYARTLDGGANWDVRVVPDADTLQFRDVHAFDADTAFLLSIGGGESSRIYRTTDGGESWAISFQNEDPNGFFDCVDFWDRQRGFAFSDSHEGEFYLIRTMDGGETWERIPPESVPDAREGEGAFAASGTCVVARPGGLGWFATGASAVDTRVFRTTDYGDTWTDVVTPIESTTGTSGIFSLTFLDDERGAALGGDFGNPDSVYLNVAVTEDGGLTWTEAGRSNLGGSVFGASYVPGAITPTLVAVAPTGTDYSMDNGQSWTRIDTVNYWGVSFISPDAGWAVGPGRIAKIRNGTLN